MVAYFVIKLKSLSYNIGGHSDFTQRLIPCISKEENVHRFQSFNSTGINLLNLMALNGLTYGGLLKYIGMLPQTDPIIETFTYIMTRIATGLLDVNKCNAELIDARDSFLLDQDKRIRDTLNTIIDPSNVTILDQVDRLHQTMFISIPMLYALNHVFGYAEQSEFESFYRTKKPNDETGKKVLACIAANKKTTFGTLLYSIASQRCCLEDFVDSFICALKKNC
jgi:hypothetical protein